MSDFGAFLDGKKSQEDNQKQFYIEAKEEWLSNIDFVYSEIESWLADYRKQGLNIDYTSSQKDEDGIGSYEFKIQNIHHGESTVRVEPQGCLFMGCKGAFDVIASRKANFSIHLTNIHKMLERNSNMEFEWKIIVSNGHGQESTYKNFEKSVFLDALMNQIK